MEIPLSSSDKIEEEKASESFNDGGKDVEVEIFDKYLDLLKDEIAIGDAAAAYALKNIHLIAEELGQALSRDRLVPLLSEAQESVETCLLTSFCDAWYALSKCIGADSLAPIVNSLEFMLNQEEPTVRNAAIEIITKIIDDHKPADSPSFELVDTVLIQMVQRLVSNEWFAGATSACYMIPKIYKFASEGCQNELRQSFQQLCEAEMYTVKLAAARNLKDIIQQVELDHAISMFWLVLKNMSIENQEDLRSHAVESCIVFAQRCTPEQNLNFNYPILKAAAQDSSWKVRDFIARIFQKIYDTLGEDEVREHLLDSHLGLLVDPNDMVKTSTIESFSEWSGILSLEMIRLYIPTLDLLAKNSPKEIRQSVCKALALFAMKLNKEDVKLIVAPTMIYLLNDLYMDVRLCVLQNIHLICDREDFYGIIGDKLIETVDKVIENPQWRHRLVIAEQLTSFFSHFGSSIFENNFSSVLFKLLLDSVWKVRNAVLISLEKICNECGSIWAVKYILGELLILYYKPEASVYAGNTSYSLRITMIQALVAVAKSIDAANMMTHIMPLLMKAVSDPIPNIRFVAVNAMSNLFVIYKNEDPEMFFQAKCALVKLTKDTDIDVQYYSKRALETYISSFSKSSEI
ncbi:hypothetical protein BEWA_008310 [Theileria equi strain WA]|uniref:Uncharacterized protein n=1 Tax=Theileria equi strain WA TaxID=1537102 RepID=L0B2I5_THEEQ|nr:hypothetical protein BEWA_008310 [Theileria equi strain WA]AFZ81421.1 hypothetical protein BEWA_008310 [Theileria equi strain WA]|eukprot:XP_004831087.1 hypothetical protein BEWA_008310 [Theileria equi strain WA]